MIGRQIKGRGFRGLLAYLDSKEGAQVLAGNLRSRTPRELAAELEQVRALRPTLTRAVFHMPIRPAPGEQLTDEQWRQIAERTIAGMGFSGSPWISYLHRDAREVHLHLVASRIAFDGSIVSDAHDYARAQRILRSIERDYGLRAVDASPESKPPRSTERQWAERTGEVSTREGLRQAILEASRSGPSVARLAERLAGRGIEVRFRVAPRGQVTGVSYRSGALAFSGTSLGPAFTWKGLQTLLGVRFDPDRDLAAVFGARHASPLSSRKESTMTEPLASDAARPDASSSVTSRTREAVHRHLRALGGERFDLVVLDSRNGGREVRTGWDAAQIDRSLGWLRQRNAAGSEILVRPERPATSLVVELGSREAYRLRDRGLEPAALVALGKERVEGWFRHGAPVPREEVAVLAPILARELGAARERDRSEFGHLAGFTTHLSVPPSEKAPYAQLRGSSGAVYERSEGVLEQARALIEVRAVERQVDRDLGAERGRRGQEIAALERAAGLPRSEPLSRRELEADLASIASAREGLLRSLAREAPAGLPAALAREGETLAAFRTLRERERGLEEATGLRPLPEQLGAERIAALQGLEGRYVEARGRSEAAEDRLAIDPSPTTVADFGDARLAGDAADAARREVDPAWRPVAAEDLARAALDHDPTALEVRFHEATVRFDAAVADLAAGLPESAEVFAAAFVERREAGLALEEVRADLDRAVRALAPEVDRTAWQLGEIEAALPAHPGGEPLRRYGEVVERLEGQEALLGAVTERLRAADLSAFDRDLDRIGRELEIAPTPERLQEYSEILGARHETAQGRDREPGAARDGSTDSGPDSGARHPDVQAAREEVAREAVRALESPGAAPVAGFRAAAERLLVVRDRADGGAAESAFLAARHELRRALRDLRPGSDGQLAEPAVARYREALDRFQVAEARWSVRLPSASTEAPDRFFQLLERVRQGDHTPATLADLHREAVRTIARSTGQVPAPATPTATREDLLSAVEAFRRAKAEFLLAARELPGRPSDPGFLAGLDRVRHAVGSYQTAARDLQVISDRFSKGGDRALPLRAYLKHPDHAGSPLRAVAAWVRQASRSGVPESRIAAHLTRGAPGSRLAVPRLFGQRVSNLVAFWGARGVYQHFRQRLHQLENAR